MPDPEKQTAVQKLKTAGRDLMPIIAVCVSAIVLTLVAVTVYKLMTEQTEETAALQPTLLDRKYLDILTRAERYMQEGNWTAAEKEYTLASNLAKKENGSTILLAELELRLANVMLKQYRHERAEKHMLKARSYLQETGIILDSQIRDLQEKIKELTASQKKNKDTTKEVAP